MTKRGAERTIRRQRVLLIITVCALVVSLAGLALSWRITSPAQQALDQGPPEQSQITAPVEKTVLSQRISLRGTMSSATTMDITAFGVGSADAESLQMVTGLSLTVGQSITAGDVVVQISGRPMIALPGVVPAYRTMSPGDKGDDVRQLQQALIELGYLDAGNDTGTFADLTQTAVAKLFEDRGYSPIHTWDELSDQAESGVEARLGEIVFIPSLPATVTQVQASVGTNLAKSGGSLLTVSCGQIVAWGTVPAGQQTGLAVGQAVDLIDGLNSRQATGTLTSIGEFQSAQTDPTTGLPVEGGEAGYPVVVTPSDGVDQAWIGANVQLSITEQTTAEAVLVVPTSAILTGTGGLTYVDVVTADGGKRHVDVTTGLSADGKTEVVAAQGEALSEGDLVVIR